MNFSFISTTEGVHIWLNDCLQHMCLITALQFGVKRQGQIYLQSDYGLLCELLLKFVTNGV